MAYRRERDLGMDRPITRRDFLDDYRGPQGDGPEKYPLDALQPGGT